MGMIMKNILLIIVSITVLSFPIYAATIHGTIYDPSLEPIDALVEINTVPKQFFVAIGGDYQFNVNPGSYILKANTSEGRAIELIEIVEDGNYTIDIIIGLDIEDPIGFIDEPDITDVTIGLNGPTGNNKDAYNKDAYSSDTLPNTLSIISIVIIILLTIAVVFLFISKNTRKNQNTSKNQDVDKAKGIIDDVEQISNITDIEMRTIALIREHSRITQKELRKMLPYSEAKISLVVAQLESAGKIKKIKKGRGNILVYVKG